VVWDYYAGFGNVGGTASRHPMTHRIILLNFSERESRVLTKAGFNVERGFVGRTQSPITSFQVPHPLFEYDVMFYNSRITSDVLREFPDPIPLTNDKGSFESLAQGFKFPPPVRITFLGGPTGAGNLLLGGLPFIQITEADPNVSSILECPSEGAFRVDALHKTLAKLQAQIAAVEQYCSAPRGPNLWPLTHHVVLMTRNGQELLSYGTSVDADTVPRYVVLPQLKDNAEGALQILLCMEGAWPQLFPDRIRREWLTTTEFLLPEEKAINLEIEVKVADTLGFVEAKEKQREKLKLENSFVRCLLVAKEDQSLAPTERLSGVVKKALEFLEFKVEDIDQKVKSAIRKEDFWVTDEDFLAITEVTGTSNKNPKIKEYNDILGRMTTIFKRQGELVPPQGATVQGLLVLNYDIENHPAKRPKVYTGEEEHIVESALDQGIGLLSTVELHKIVVAVKEGRLTKNDARALLKKSGRIEFGAERPPKG
jgi:hypothetical protein